MIDVHIPDHGDLLVFTEVDLVALTQYIYKVAVYHDYYVKVRNRLLTARSHYVGIILITLRDFDRLPLMFRELNPIRRVGYYVIEGTRPLKKSGEFPIEIAKAVG